MKCILVADDDEFNFFIIESLLSHKYVVVHAKNGEEAVNVIKSHDNISLILMDIQMPVMDGFAATQEIRKINKEVPIIAQTAYAIKKVKEKAFDLGFSDFIEKPLTFDTLNFIVEKHILPL